MELYQTYISDTTKESLGLAQLSHEIRNPLTLINCTLGLLGGRYPQLKNDELWQQLQDDVDYLKKLTFMLSDLKSCDKIYVNQINMHKLLCDINQSFQPLFCQENKTLSLLIDHTLPLVMCDEIKIRQALTNLLKNALEATTEGDSVEIHVKCTSTRLRISIRDNGKGMNEETAAHIFKPFVTNKEGGTGLGLAVTKKIIDMHNGTIRVYSKEHLGTKFVISLPLIQR